MTMFETGLWAIPVLLFAMLVIKLMDLRNQRKISESQIERLTLAVSKASRFMRTSWLSSRNTPGIWQTHDGRILQITDMDDDHLANTLHMFRRVTNPKMQELRDESKRRRQVNSAGNSGCAAHCSGNCRSKADISAIESVHILGPEIEVDLDEDEGP